MTRSRWFDESLLTIKGGKATVNRDTLNLANVKPLKVKPKWDSKLEASYDGYLAALKFAKEIREFYYHGCILILPGGQKYTPDFLVWTKDLKPEIHEVKGSPKMKNARDGITRLKVAAGTFQCFTFKLIYRRKGQWEVTTV